MNRSVPNDWYVVGRYLLGLVAIIWVVELVDTLLGHRLDAWGIIPRTASGLLPGVVLAPFLHAGFGHALLNTVPLVVLGGLVALRGSRAFVALTAFIVLAGGVAVWLLGRPAMHIGASGLVFGYFGYLVARGYFERSLPAVIIAVVTLVLYGGLTIGVLPLRSGVSWEGHLFGLLAGIAAARLWAGDKKTRH